MLPLRIPHRVDGPPVPEWDARDALVVLDHVGVGQSALDDVARLVGHVRIGPIRNGLDGECAGADVVHALLALALGGGCLVEEPYRLLDGVVVGSRFAHGTHEALELTSAIDPVDCRDRRAVRVASGDRPERPGLGHLCEQALNGTGRMTGRCALCAQVLLGGCVS